MPVLAIPNLSEGSDRDLIEALSDAAEAGGARTLDTHADPIHARSVLTVVGEPEELVVGLSSLAVEAKRHLDLRHNEGVHPRLGVLDVCPFVPLTVEGPLPVDLARWAAAAIAGAADVPVYLYGAAALRKETERLPDLRKGGLDGLMRRAQIDLPPDYGTSNIDPRTGVVCVGARRVLIAFNVWLHCAEEVARAIARKIRTAGGGPQGIRALGFDMGDGLSQVSMNLIDPDITGIDGAFEAVATEARERGVRIARTELVGLPPSRYLPDPGAEAARLMDPPGRSLESALNERRP